MIQVISFFISIQNQKIIWNGWFESFVSYINNENISYTESKNNDGEWSYHYVVPSIEISPSDVKHFFDT